MKRFGLAIAAVLALTAFAVAPSASAQMGGSMSPTHNDDNADAAPAKARPRVGPYDKDQIAQGKKDAPAAVQGAGMPCTVVDAASLGSGDVKNPDDPKGKPVKATSYEVACQQGMGYILQVYTGLSPKIYDCVSLSGSVSACRLPENGDPKRMLAGVVAASGRTCTINNARALGATKAGDSFFEVGCAEGAGFVLKAPAPTSSAAPVADDCAREVGSNLECKFTSKDQIQAALNAKLNGLVASSGKPCQISGSREVGADSSGVIYYEVACGGGVGYMLSEKGGQFVRAIDCGKASALAGGCTLTDATKAESAEAGTYTRLASNAGFQCQVDKYRYIGMDPKSHSEVVELHCNNRADGTVALFGADNHTATFYDCIAAGALGQSCKLSDPSTAFGKYTQALASKGKSTCKVSNAKWLGVTASGDAFVETACSDGLPGWVISTSPGGAVKELLTCGQAKSAGVACSLPGNVK